MLPFGLGPGELLVFGLIALLLFGKRLPEVARSLGKGVVEFKKGLRGVEDEMHSAVYADESASSRPAPPDERVETAAPKFEPPASAPH
jgi:sec-independent protein translocase protein TatA